MRGYGRQGILVIEKPSSNGDPPLGAIASAIHDSLLSVITPARNMARFLPDTLDSVAALRTPHEHIVIDGASDDGTVELLEGAEDPHLTWISEPDSGQTEAVNKGLRLAQGDLLAWVNADDAYIPDAVDRASSISAQPGGRGDLRRRSTTSTRTARSSAPWSRRSSAGGSTSTSAPSSPRRRSSSAANCSSRRPP